MFGQRAGYLSETSNRRNSTASDIILNKIRTFFKDHQIFQVMFEKTHRQTFCMIPPDSVTVL